MGESSPGGRPARRRMLDLGAGGWVLLVALFLVSAIAAWRIVGMIGSRGAPAIGDGKNVATYRFDLSEPLVALDRIVAAGIPKDGVRARTDPPLLSRQEVDSLGRTRWGKFLVSNDRVIGLVVGGQARAYPVRVMNWHEVVNDTLGGRRIAVTFSPLCDAVVVFDREVNGEILRFGVSGLLFNSNLLMYDDREDDRRESLWSQLQARAIAGPAAAASRSLEVLPCALVRWAEWRDRHPSTTVLAPDPAMAGEYRRDPYGSYASSDLLRFPVDPLPPAEGPDRKTPVVIVGGGRFRRIFPLPMIASRARPDGVWEWYGEGGAIRFLYRDDPATVAVETEGVEPPPAVRYSDWFSWYATHPQTAMTELVR